MTGQINRRTKTINTKILVSPAESASWINTDQVCNQCELGHREVPVRNTNRLANSHKWKKPYTVRQPKQSLVKAFVYHTLSSCVSNIRTRYQKSPSSRNNKISATLSTWPHAVYTDAVRYNKRQDSQFWISNRHWAITIGAHNVHNFCSILKNSRITGEKVESSTNLWSKDRASKLAWWLHFYLAAVQRDIFKCKFEYWPAKENRARYFFVS